MKAQCPHAPGDRESPGLALALLDNDGRHNNDYHNINHSNHNASIHLFSLLSARIVS